MTGPNDPRWNDPQNPDGDTFDEFFADRRPQYDGSDEIRRGSRAGDETVIAPQHQGAYTAPLPSGSGSSEPPAEPRYYDQSTDPEPRRTSAWLPAAIIIVSLFALAAVAYFAFGRDSNSPTSTAPVIPTATSSTSSESDTTSPSPQSSSGSESSSSASSPSSPSDSSSSTPSGSSSFATTLPAGQQACSTTVAAANGTTCEFANNVAAAVAGADTTSGGDFEVKAFSPATKQAYTMKCTQSQYITCTSTAGTAAVSILRN